MKILYITPYAPGHIRVRSFHLPSHLAIAGHQITLAYPERQGDHQSRVDELREQGVSVIAARNSAWGRGLNSALALLRRRPMQAGYGWSAPLARRLAIEVEHNPPDVVHVEHLRAVDYGHSLDRGGRSRSWVTVWDSVDCISALLSEARRHSRSKLWRWVARLDFEPTRRYERRALGAFDRVLCATEPDQRALLAAAEGTAPREPFELRQGVDLEAFPFRDPFDRPPRLVFSGAMGYHPNVAAALYLVERIMPAVWSLRSNVELVIVGSNAPRSLERAATRCSGKVRITGWVPRVQPHLADAAAAVIPLRYGAGVQNKLLQAMACGTPVVTDPRTAAAVGAVPRADVLTAESDVDFAHKILTLLTDPTLRVRLARSARRRVESRFSWQTVAQELAEHYREVLDARR